jgi:sortase A
MGGAGLLGYVGSQYLHMYRIQRQLQVRWNRQTQSADAGSGRQDKMPVTASHGMNGGASISHNTPEAVARITIPKIHLDAVVVEGVSSQDLAAGPGHITETALPGETGNAVITAHRDTYFRHLPELDQGDEIILHRGNQAFRYRVSSKKIVQPDDLGVLAPTSDAELTLITCYPVHYIGPAPERLVIFSKLVP